MQAFAYRHLVPANDWTVMVTGRPAGPARPWNSVRAEPIRLPLRRMQGPRLRPPTETRRPKSGWN